MSTKHRLFTWISERFGFTFYCEHTFQHDWIEFQLGIAIGDEYAGNTRCITLNLLVIRFVFYYWKDDPRLDTNCTFDEI